jgi:hypothetical protein
MLPEDPKHRQHCNTCHGFVTSLTTGRNRFRASTIPRMGSPRARCESLPTGPPRKFSKYSQDIRAICPGLLSLTSQPPRSITRATEDIYCLKALKWMELVEEYSACSSLIVPSDKLVAISGLAKSLNYDCQYLAGIWGRYLPLQMLWRVSLEVKNKPHDFEVCSEYQAPSWSWASVNTKIEFKTKEYYARNGHNQCS